MLVNPYFFGDGCVVKRFTILADLVAFLGLIMPATRVILRRKNHIS